MRDQIRSLRKRIDEKITEYEDNDVPTLVMINVLRSFGQVVFLDNPFSGFIIIIGIAIAQPRDFVYGFVATVSAVLFTLQIMGKQPFMGLLARNLGLFGFNAVLVGMGISVFLPNEEDDGLHWFLLFIPAIAFGIFSVLVKMTIESLTKDIPVLTYPFNLSMVVWLSFSYSIKWIKSSYIVDEAVGSVSDFNFEDYLNDIDGGKLIEGIFKGFSQVYLVDSVLAGAFIFAAMLVHDEEVAFLALLGSAVGCCTAVLMGEVAETIYIGLFGFNPLLVLIVCGKILVNLKFLSRWTTRLPCALLFTLFAVPVQVCTASLLLPIHIPGMTFPFCFMANIFLLIERWIHVHVPAEEIRRSTIIDATTIRKLRRELTEHIDVEYDSDESCEVQAGTISMSSVKVTGTNI